ncbi:MAG TPA: CPBP family intramembrane glutamic endopeptidase [Candidatus Didemnitutus sp.]|jgi:hypothetical protein
MGDLTAYQDVINVAEWTVNLVGVVLLGRLAFSPDFRARQLRREPLPRWPVSPFDFLLLLAMAAMLAVAGTVMISTSFGPMINRSGSREGLLVVASGLGIHGSALLAWPLLRGLLRRLTPELGDHPGLHPFEKRSRCSPTRALLLGLATFAAALPVVFAVSYLWGLALHAMGLPEEPQDLIGIFSRTHSPLVMGGMLAVACLLAPLNEELIFRRSIYRFVRDRLGWSRALVISALVFGLVHGNWFGFLPLTVFGALLALAYELTGDIRVPMIAHALFNLNTIIGIMAGFQQ